MKASARKKSTNYPYRPQDVPVTQAMLFGVRDELKAHVKSEVHGVKSEIQGLKSAFHRMEILMEEQNARNLVVLDGLSNLFQKQECLDEEVTRLNRNPLAQK